MIKKEYYGYWSTGSSYNRNPITDTNLGRLQRTMREIARANNAGSGCKWWIQDGMDQYNYEYPVATGTD